LTKAILLDKSDFIMDAARVLVRHPDLVGECPVWDAVRKCLLWTDNRSKRVYLHPSEGGVAATLVDEVQVYAFTLQRDGSLLLFLSEARVAHAQEGRVVTMLDGLRGEETKRFNDVLVDRAGRVLAGLLDPAKEGSGVLYSLTPERKTTLLLDGLRLPNGMALSADERQLYLADTWAKKILVLDYDAHTGAAARPRVFIDLAAEEGYPDGLTLDAQGDMWIAMTEAWTVARYAPDGRLRQRIRLPARKPTSVAFGGEDMRTLFITSAARQGTPGEEIGPAGGALLRIATDTQGRLEHRSDWR
jgi:sugar lactone lactonase YvrE